MTDELRIDATPYSFRRRDPHAPGIAGQFPMLVFGQVYLGTHHGVIPLQHPKVLHPGLFQGHGRGGRHEPDMLVADNRILSAAFTHVTPASRRVAVHPKISIYKDVLP